MWGPRWLLWIISRETDPYRSPFQEGAKPHRKVWFRFVQDGRREKGLTIQTSGFILRGGGRGWEAANQCPQGSFRRV